MRVQGQTLALDTDQILLRGSSLRNTAWVYGVAIYTGHDSKVMMNSANSRPKYSKIEKATNRYIILGIFIQFTVCMVSAIVTSLWEVLNVEPEGQGVYYLELGNSYRLDGLSEQSQRISDSGHLYYTIPINFAKWFIAMMNFVAISLLVSLEMVKFAQGVFIESDYMMHDEEKDLPAKCQSSNLNEELGMVNYIFSDKTGTLT